MYISFPLNEIIQAGTSFLFTFIHVQSTCIVTSTAQTDLGLRYRTFSQTIKQFLKLHNDIKQAETLNIFKISLNKWKVECKCNFCTLCKIMNM